MADRINSSVVGEAESYAFVSSAPVVLTSVVASNESTSAACQLVITNGAGSTTLMGITLPAAGTVVWTGRAALPKGLGATVAVGSARVTVTYV